MSLRTMNYPDAFSGTEAIKTRIEQEIYELKNALAACQSRYNSLSSISRLPPEILSGIFKVLVEDDTDCTLWVQCVTHVCSHWRHVAMECPSLWGLSIPLRCSRWTMEMLKRSKSAPLTVSACFPEGTKITTFLEILESLPRIQNLRIIYSRFDHSDDHALFRNAIANLTGAAPILEVLRVFGVTTDVPLPENIFSRAGGAPRLRRLELGYCHFSWQPWLLCRLTDLTIWYLSPAHRISISHLISVLADSPNLKNVHLVSVLHPFTADSTVSISPQTTLPQITRLQFEDTLLNCTGFFSGITFPETVAVNVHCSLPENEASASGLAAPLLLQDLLMSLSQYCMPFHALVLGINSTEAFNIHRRKSHNINNHSDHHLPLVKVIHGPAIGSMTDMRFLPVQHLRALRVNFIEMSSSYWIKTYGRLKLLKYIKSSGCNVPGFIEALFSGVVGCPNMSFAQGNTAGRLKFRSLELLAICQVDLDIDCGGQRLVDALKTCLKERRRRGLALPKLEFLWCENLREQDLEDLKPLVKRTVGHRGYRTGRW